MLQEFGLTTRQARDRLEKYGRNEIKKTKKVNPLKILLSQFTSPLILILIVVAIISWGIGFVPGQQSSSIDAILILLIVIASGASGFLQEFKSEQTIEALQNISIPKTIVVRDGGEIEISIADLVPGDLILLRGGDIVPADAKLVECFNIKVDESILTGESKAIEKKVSDEIYMDTFINSGSAKAVVVRTGMQTKVGSIALGLQKIKEEKTPFQIEIDKFSKKISIVVVAMIAVVIYISLFKYSVYLSLLTAISLAVAVIPEGLPAVVALTLAVAAKVMSKNNVLIRKLAITESIGAVDIICTDKTGTLTKNEMTVTKLFLNNKTFDAEEINDQETKEVMNIIVCGALCNNSSIGYDGKRKKKYFGDQTEVALRKISEKFGFEKEVLEKQYKRIDEISFTSKRKMMSVVYKDKGKCFVYSKGAPEILIEKCDRIYENGKITKLDKKTKKKILEKNKEFAHQALRVLGFAFKETKSSGKDVEKNLVWLGLQAMIDPARPKVKQALADCRTAGIRVIMLTGDNPLTAQAIADEIGLGSREIIEGKELDKLSDKELGSKLRSGVNIFARISPFHKLRILSILKENSRVVMTGDGVNDALALKKADVGVAMGIRGTEVAKEASDIILLDDNFASIVVAIEQGRRIFDNIRKFVNYLFVCNFAEVGVLFLSVLFLSLTKPVLLPIQLLWINLLTDGLPALALGVDPARVDIMNEPPRRKGEPLINTRLMLLIGVIGVKKMLILLTTFFLVLPFGEDIARSTLFTGFILYEFVRIAAIRYQEELNWFSNKWLIIALVGSLLLQMIIIYTPMGKFFHVVPLGLYAWIILLSGIVLGYVLAIGIVKLITRYVPN